MRRSRAERALLAVWVGVPLAVLLFLILMWGYGAAGFTETQPIIR